MTASGTELRAVLTGLGVVVFLVVAQAAIGAQHRLFGHDASAHESASACLIAVKGLALDEDVRDPIASTASGGAVSTVVAGNPVTLSFPGSDGEAARLIRSYSAIAGNLEPAHIGLAIDDARPYGVDILSEVEFAPGKKDLDRLELLLAAVRRAERRMNGEGSPTS